MQLQPPPDELARERAHSGADNPVKVIGADDEVRALGVEPQVDHDHLDILLHAPQVGREPPRRVGILTLQRQAHGGDGRFDLVRPERVVVDHGAHARVRLRLRAACPLVERADERLIVLLADAGGGGELRRVGRGSQTAQRLVTPTQVQKVRREQRKTQRRAERERVPHRPQRQPVQREADRKHCREERERREYAPFLTQILHKKLHIFTQSDTPRRISS